MAGAFAGGVQSLISCPMELAKTKMQLQGVLGPDPLDAKKAGIFQKPALYKSPVDCLWKLYSEQVGFPILYWRTVGERSIHLGT